MTITSFITALAIVAGTPTVAMANPERGYDRYGASGARIWYPQPAERRNISWYTGPVYPVASGSFSPVTEPTRMENFPESFDLQRAGRIHALQLEAVQGRTFVRSITVVYKSGATETIPVNQAIGRRYPTTSPIDLREAVALVTVDGRSPPGSAYRILGAG